MGVSAPRARAGGKAKSPPLNRADWRIIWHLVALIPICSLFWIAQSQVWNTYNLWARDHVQLTFGSWTMPVPWLQSIDGLSPFVLLPAILWLWRWQARRGREPDEPAKIAIGCFLFAVATFWLAGSAWVLDAHGRTPLAWVLVFHLVSNAGWLYFTPIVSAIYSRMGPRSVNATLMGANSIAVFIGSLVSGRMGSLYEVLPAAQFWALHGVLVGLGGVLILLMGARLRREFGPRGPEPSGALSPSVA